MSATKLNRRRLQYSLRSLLVFMVLASIGMAWFGAKYRAACQQRDAVAAIRALGGVVVYDYEDRAWRSRNATAEPPGPVWARRLLGVDFLADVVAVGCVGHAVSTGLSRMPFTDAWLEHIGKLRGLERLDLQRSRVSDAGLERLEGLTRLRELNLTHTKITDAGMERIGKLAGLEVLSLECTAISDSGVKNLRELTRLRELDLGLAPVTEVGLGHVGRLARLEVLTIGGNPASRVTDAGLEKLEGLKRLRRLKLSWPGITDAGLEHIGKLSCLEVLMIGAVPATAVTDAGLEHLEGLSELRRLDLGRSHVTADGVAKLQRTLPKCAISFGNAENAENKEPR
jgi:hypothetical protein